MSSAKSCEPLLAPNHRAHVSLEAGISQRQLDAVLRKMDSLGLVALTKPEAGHDLLVVADSDEFWSRLSRLEGVRRVSRQVPGKETFETWKRGRRTGQGLIYGEYNQSERSIWAQMEEPIRGLPPRDLESIARLAREKGFWIMVDLNRPKDAEAIKVLEEIHGGRLIFPQDIPIDSKIVRYPGVVLHLAPDSHSLKIRGDINLAIGLDRFYDKINKVTEYSWVTSIAPNLMSPSTTPRELYASAGKKFEGLRAETMELVRRYIYEPQGWRLYDELSAKLEQYLDQVFRLAYNKYRKGVFFKWAYDYATKESDGIVTDETPTKKLARRYLDHLAWNRPKLSLKSHRLDSPALAELLTDSEDSLVMITHSLLTRLDEVLIQRKLDIRKTESGDMMEFRVDALYGHALNSTFRMGHDYFPDEAAAAKKFVQDFLDQLPARERYFSAGFDVVLLENGKFSIIETNPTTASSFLDPGSLPMSSAMILSTLLGRPTPMLAYLQQFTTLPLDKQIAIVRNAPNFPREINSFSKVPRGEFLDFYRQYLNTKVTDRASADRELKKYRDMIKQAGAWDDGYSRWVYVGLRQHFKRRFG
jgi:hypothetical protein